MPLALVVNSNSVVAVNLIPATTATLVISEPQYVALTPNFAAMPFAVVVGTDTFVPIGIAPTTTAVLTLPSYYQGETGVTIYHFKGLDSVGNTEVFWSSANPTYVNPTVTEPQFMGNLFGQHVYLKRAV